MLSDVCITIKQEKSSEWYEGGCFKNKPVSHYILAKPKETYKFNSLLIQARDVYDPFVLSTKSSEIAYLGWTLIRYTTYCGLNSGQQ